MDRELHKTLANGMTVSHLYDGGGRETLLANRQANGAGLAVYTATYDRVGNRLTSLELDGSRVTYGYDRSYQLTSEQRSGTWTYDLAYEYDGVGNRLRKLDAGLVTTYQYNAAQELLLVTPPTGAPTTQTWDANGNLALENTGGLLTSYVWDSENRLLQVAAPAETDEYAYAADGKRRRKTTGGGVKLFTWDGENLLLEASDSLVLEARYTDFPGWWGGLVSSGLLPSTVFYGFDLTASCRVETTPAGWVLSEPVYDAFGVEYPVLDGPEDPVRYVGLFGYWQDAIGRYYVRARHLAPGVGRWVSRDPMEEWPWGRWYPYCGSNGVNRMDPSGIRPPIRPTPSDIIHKHCRGCQTDPATLRELEQFLAWLHEKVRTHNPQQTAAFNGCVAAADAKCKPHPQPFACFERWALQAVFTCPPAHTDTDCDPGLGRGDNSTGLAGITDSSRGCEIKLCLNDDRWRRGVFRDKAGDPTIPQMAVVVLHELAHCCGAPGHDLLLEPPELSCASIIACCLYQSVKPGRHPNSCKRGTRGRY